MSQEKDFEMLPVDLSPGLVKKLIDGKEVRIFSNASLQQSVDRVLATLPNDAKGAVVAHADLGGASLSVVGKVGNNWTVVASGYRTWQGQLSAEADIRYSW